jgi:ribosomal-protein-alanine N-acetyltransferase
MAPALPNTLQLAPMCVDDIPQVMAIDHLSFPLPWSATSYRHELTQNPASHFTVAITGPPRDILGYIGYWFIVDEAHINTLAVHPAWRGLGLGEQLLLHALAQARAEGARLATLEVRASNTVAQRLYSKHGFERVGRRKKYYQNNQEDALLLSVHL